MSNYIKCNVCGRNIDTDAENYFTIAHIMPYGSKHDGDYMKIHMCMDCADDMIDSCEIDPIVENQHKN